MQQQDTVQALEQKIATLDKVVLRQKEVIARLTEQTKAQEATIKQLNAQIKKGR